VVANKSSGYEGGKKRKARGVKARKDTGVRPEGSLKRRNSLRPQGKLGGQAEKGGKGKPNRKRSWDPREKGGQTKNVKAGIGKEDQNVGTGKKRDHLKKSWGKECFEKNGEESLGKKKAAQNEANAKKLRQYRVKRKGTGFERKWSE